MDSIYTSKQNYIVLVRCQTYNQSKYIEDALNGFAMQQTNFPFVCLIIDDCSTDGEQNTIKAWMERECDMKNVEYVEIEYSHIILVPHKTNKFCTFAFYLLKKNLYGNPLKQELIKPWREQCEYEAICEGDDYWIDSLKLQKQVDFLEKNSKFDMVCARFNHLYDETGEISKKDLYDSIIDSYTNGMELRPEHFLYRAIPHPCTVMYRNGTLTDNSLYSQLKYSFDIPLYWCYMKKHKVWLINEKMSMYRKHVGSLTYDGHWSNKIYYAYADIFSHTPDDRILSLICANEYRRICIFHASNDGYSPKILINDLREYLKYRPKIGNIFHLVKDIGVISMRKVKNKIKNYLC